MRRAVFLAWRLHRAELVAVTLASAAIALAWLAVAADLAAVHRHCQSIGPSVAPCGGLPEAGQYYTDASQNLMPMVGPMAGALPFIAGLVLGVPERYPEVLAREAGVIGLGSLLLGAGLVAAARLRRPSWGEAGSGPEPGPIGHARVALSRRCSRTRSRPRW